MMKKITMTAIAGAMKAASALLSDDVGFKGPPPFLFNCEMFFAIEDSRLSHAAVRDAPRLVGARPHCIRLREFLSKRSSGKNDGSSLRECCVMVQAAVFSRSLYSGFN